MIFTITIHSSLASIHAVATYYTLTQLQTSLCATLKVITYIIGYTYSLPIHISLEQQEKPLVV